MSNATRPASARRWWRRLAGVPTAWHLLCAELELRAADTGALPAALRRARARNLDRLRDYRRRGEFPDDPGAPRAYGPCFIDGEGRRCAVAHLMHASGAAAAAREVARVANYARLPDIRSDALDAWAASSGLTRAELARIQPSYPRDPGPLLPYYWGLVAAVWGLGALAILAMLGNARRLLRAPVGRWVGVGAGIFLGVALLALGLLAYELAAELKRPAPLPVDLSRLSPRAWQAGAYAGSVQIHGIAAFVVGVLSIVVAVKRTSPADRASPELPPGALDKSPATSPPPSSGIAPPPGVAPAPDRVRPDQPG